MSVLNPGSHLEFEPADGAPKKRRRRFPRSNHTWVIMSVTLRHPFKTGWLGDSLNEYGTPVSVTRCTHCRSVVARCPALTVSQRALSANWDCLHDSCPSYDPHRDVEIFFAGPEDIV